MALKIFFLTIEEIASGEDMLALREISQESYDRAVAALQYKDINAIFGFLTPVISIIAVLMMWNLKKPGFILYVFAELLPYALLASTTGMEAFNMSGGMMESFQSLIYIILVLVVVFDIAFIIMYALNLKYMK